MFFDQPDQKRLGSCDCVAGSAVWPSSSEIPADNKSQLSLEQIAFKRIQVSLPSGFASYAKPEAA